MHGHISGVREGQPVLAATLAGVLSEMDEQEIKIRLSFIQPESKLSLAELVSLFCMSKEMALQECASSNVAAYGVDSHAGVVAVRFKSKTGDNTEYRYLGVPENMLRAIESSLSKGSAISMLRSSGVAFLKLK